MSDGAEFGSYFLFFFDSTLHWEGYSSDRSMEEMSNKSNSLFCMMMEDTPSMNIQYHFLWKRNFLDPNHWSRCHFFKKNVTIFCDSTGGKRWKERAREFSQRRNFSSFRRDGKWVENMEVYSFGERFLFSEAWMVSRISERRHFRSKGNWIEMKLWDKFRI